MRRKKSPYKLRASSLCSNITDALKIIEQSFKELERMDKWEKQERRKWPKDKMAGRNRLRAELDK
jgi:hypothetical protein